MAKSKNRILFRKSGRACYISHLDLMATFQRAFLRSEIDVWQTEGFNRHIYVSIALPLSVGYSSDCEILEFNLNEGASMDDVAERMNRVLPEGIEVVECYEAVTPLKRIVDLDWSVTMEYDNGVPEGAVEGFRSFLMQESCVIRKKSKKSKKGYTELDIIPMIKAFSLEEQENKVIFNARIAAQNPGLNPALILDTFGEANPQWKCDFARFHRCEVLGEDGVLFR